MIELLDKYKDIISEQEIILWDIEPDSYRFKARITFIDNSSLIVRDYIFVHYRKYSFHWQKSDGDLIARWDNARHWEKIETFPFHKHEKSYIFPSKEVTLEDILIHIMGKRGRFYYFRCLFISKPP